MWFVCTTPKQGINKKGNWRGGGRKYLRTLLTVEFFCKSKTAKKKFCEFKKTIWEIHKIRQSRPENSPYGHPFCNGFTQIIQGYLLNQNS